MSEIIVPHGGSPVSLNVVQKPMISLRSIFLLLVVLFSSNLFADEKHDAWRSLSAHCQNLHQQLLRLGPDTAADPSMHEEALRDIENALNLLVKLGELHEKKITLKTPDEIGDESTQKIFESIEPLSKTYGVFVASEMCGLGAHLYFTTIKTDEQVELHLRLPQNELKTFENALFKLGVLAIPEAQQDGAEQPATAPESKSEGKEKPKPESEGRYQ